MHHVTCLPQLASMHQAKIRHELLAGDYLYILRKVDNPLLGIDYKYCNTDIVQPRYIHSLDVLSSSLYVLSLLHRELGVL